jgi:Tfp pilus assembly protein PilN
MKAVNLLPREAQRSFSSVRGLNGGTNALFGVLLVLVVLATGYVVLSNNVTSKREELARTQQLQAASEKQVAALKPYSDLENLRQSLLGKVRELAGGRFDWPSAIDRVVRAFPSDASLTNFEGAAATDGGAPTITLSGCTPSHDDVAGLIDRLRAVKGVAGVSLTSSTIKSGDEQAGGDTCPHAETFELSVSMEAPASAPTTGAATAAAPATPATGGTP